MATVSLDTIKKRFGPTEVIKGVSLDVADGEFIVIVGPSGCGKSTLLRMVAGLETITEGELRIGDRRANDLEPMDRDIAMVFQNYALYPHMSVAQNMGYGLKIAGLPKAEIAAKVQDAAKLLQLTELLDRKPRQVGNVSVSPWGAPSCARPRCSCSTNRSQISMPSFGCRCASKSANCRPSSGSHRSMSPMIRSRR
jgi:ABC-type multidrug transport system ATPase subunit